MLLFLVFLIYCFLLFVIFLHISFLVSLIYIKKIMGCCDMGSCYTILIYIYDLFRMPVKYCNNYEMIS